MKRVSIVPSALLVAALLPTAASAKIVELGSTKSPLVAPTCPAGIPAANCTIVLTGITGLETIRDGQAYPTRVAQPGYIVAFTLGLSSLDANTAKRLMDIQFLDSHYGVGPRAKLTVLKPTGRGRRRSWVATAESPTFNLLPYLGEVVQFPLLTALPVTRGETVALTVPTWAPVLSFGLPRKEFAYRQSRSKTATADCAVPSTTDQTESRVGMSAFYGCSYPGTRVEYSATEITTPSAPKG